MATNRTDKVLMTGHLYKQGASYHNWKKRYFVLRQSSLSYFAVEGDKHPKGVIDLTKGRGVRTKDQCLLRNSDWPKDAKADRAFGLALDKRTYYLYGIDTAAVDDWKSMLQQRIQEVGKPNSEFKGDCIGAKPTQLSQHIGGDTQGGCKANGCSQDDLVEGTSGHRTVTPKVVQKELTR